jgi:probable rRNA maturation factor
MSIEIISKQRKLKIDRRAIRRLTKLILEEHGEPEGDVTIVFAEDDFVHDLNLAYRGVDRPTDVLAFSMSEGEEPGDTGDPEDLEIILGDVVVSVDRAAVQARRYKRTEEQEILKLVAHGVLHLLGYDHESARERAEMRRLENRHIRALGITTT